jgi:hypothetical protein
VVGTPYNTTRQGPVRVVRNDRLTADSDGDGLGNGLETEACTCNASGFFQCPGQGSYFCTTATRHDTDRDGLRDDWELIGLDHAVAPQLFPLWGASPRHRDIFAEIDIDDVPGGGFKPAVRATEAMAIAAARPFANLPISNLDGVPGVSLHLDIGQPCSSEPGDVDGVSTVCGNFGGVASAAPDPAEEDDCAQLLGSYLHPTRHGKFHWLLRTDRDSMSAFDTCAYIDIDSNDLLGNYIAHEIGHQLGLEHWGTNSAGMMNRKPNYPSLMNYTYSKFLSGSPANVRFSTGELAAYVLNPRNVSETTDFGGTAQIDFMLGGTNPHGYRFEVDPENPRQIDWNRDGEFDSSVRAHIFGQPETKDSGGIHAPQMIGQTTVPFGPSEASIGAAYFGGKRYVVGNLGGWLWYTSRGAGTVFPSFQPLTPVGFVAQADSGPTAIPYDPGGGALLYVFAMASGSQAMCYAAYDTNVQIQGSWACIPLPPGILAREVSATVHGATLYVVLTNAAAEPFAAKGEVWMGALHVGDWTGWTRVEVGGVTVKSVYEDDFLTPGIAAAPDDKLYLFTRRPDVATVFGLRVHEYDTASGTWADSSRDWTTSATHDKCPVTGRVNALFRAHRTGAGAPLPSGNGAIWVWYNGTCTTDEGTQHETFYSWSWGKLSAQAQDFKMGRWHRTHLGPSACNNVYEKAHAVTMIDHPDGLAVYVRAQGTKCGDVVLEAPHADGEATPPVPLVDHNDVPTIEAALCSSVHWIDGVCHCSSATCSPAIGPIPGPIYDCSDQPEPDGP